MSPRPRTRSGRARPDDVGGAEGLLGPPAGWTVVGARRSLLVHRRSLAVTLIALMIAVVIGAVSLATGTFRVSASELLDVLGGGGEPMARFMILDQRLPRWTAALTVGGMLAVSGTVFQSVARNPLGSPDVVGFTRGATTGALLALITLGGGIVSTGTGALLGGAATAVVVIVLTMRRGAGGDGLVLAGIAVGQMLSSLNDYLLASTDVESAEAAKTWQYGSLNAITWGAARPLLVTAALLVPLGLAISREGGVLETGDDTAAALGSRARRTRVVLIGYGVVLASACVTATGPIGFLALAAPQVARRLSRVSGLGVLPSFGVGAALLTLSDLVAGRLLSPFQIPVGLITSAVGGFYLMWLVGPGRTRRPMSHSS